MNTPSTTATKLWSIALLLLCAACHNKELYPPHAVQHGPIPVKVIIHWKDTPPEHKPVKHGMRVHLFDNESGQSNRTDLPADGGLLWLNENKRYQALCYDYFGNEVIDFRHEHSAVEFHIYKQPRTGPYNQYVLPVSGEETVGEPEPTHFYAATNANELHTARTRLGDTLELHFHPVNILREYTFAIDGVQGIKNILSLNGAISGMASTWDFHRTSQGGTPATMLFSRITARNDSLVGTFCGFGQGHIENKYNRLTIGAVTQKQRYIYASWDETVSTQMENALHIEGWRQQNGGYDIVLHNNGRFDFTNETGSDDSNFKVDVGSMETVDIFL
ncbi:MAG: DUF5119 domain-containing protein [Mediterranea sp.]|jgi:hypothetical protein|nr:DUF5119 domain-containing protein [Mediterranea sp.]